MGGVMMYWTKELWYTITPRGGPMRSMETLIDANHALSKDLPLAYLRRRVPELSENRQNPSCPLLRDFGEAFPVAAAQ